MGRGDVHGLNEQDAHRLGPLVDAGHRERHPTERGEQPHPGGRNRRYVRYLGVRGESFQNGGAIAYVTHPYIFKGSPGDQPAFINVAGSLPVIATEFGDANVVEIGHSIPPTQCNGSLYANYINTFEGANMNWTAWAWIVDEWGCGFPQMSRSHRPATQAEERGFERHGPM